MLNRKFNNLLTLSIASFRRLRVHSVGQLYSLSTSAKTKDHQHEDAQEVQHHANFAKDWWKPKGPMYPLLSMNAIRVPFIRDGIISTGKVNSELINTAEVLQGVNILEVGCGGGFLTEQFARLHANVTGIDLGEDVIRVAKQHVQNESPELLDRIQYKVESIEFHAKDHKERYDAVVASEVIEHVSDKVGFLTSCVDALKPGGSIFITTLNKNFVTWIGGIIIAENILRMVPKGTHHYEKFIGPIDTQRILESLNCSTIIVNGFIYQFWNDTWKWIPTQLFSYALQAIKRN